MLARTILSYPILSCPILQGTLSYRKQLKEGGEETGTGNNGKTTSKSGLALSGIYYLGKAENREERRKLVVNLQWCHTGQPDDGIAKNR